MDSSLFNALGITLQTIATIEPLDERKVGRDEFGWGFVSTVRVGDGLHPFETAVEHPDYYDGKIVVVEAYDTVSDAMTGHARWVSIMTADELPDSLTEAGNAVLEAELHRMQGGATIHTRRAA